MKRAARLTLAVIVLLVLILGGLYIFLTVSPAESCPIEAEALIGQVWAEGAKMPTRRSELAAAVLDDMVYVGGGLTFTGASKAFEVYDPAGDNWQKAAPLPVALHHFGMAAVDGRIYVSGGYKGNNLSNPSDAVWVFDPAGDNWSAAPSMPGGRAAHAMVDMDGLLYVVGGAGVGSTFIWVYDPAEESWDTLPTSLPTPREHLAAVALDGRLFVIGGRWPGRGNLATVELYDPDLGTWDRAPDMPTARGGLTAAAVGERLHVTGGEDFERSPSCTFSQHERFDPAAGHWLTLAPLPTSRHGLASAAVGERWIVFGGGTKAAAQTLVSASDLVEIFGP
jgi:N-acetylneuraminic acid mutarotase